MFRDQKAESALGKTQINNQYSCFHHLFFQWFSIQFRDLPKRNQDYKNIK